MGRKVDKTGKYFPFSDKELDFLKFWEQCENNIKDSYFIETLLLSPSESVSDECDDIQEKLVAFQRQLNTIIITIAKNRHDLVFLHQYLAEHSEQCISRKHHGEGQIQSLKSFSPLFGCFDELFSCFEGIPPSKIVLKSIIRKILGFPGGKPSPNISEDYPYFPQSVIDFDNQLKRYRSTLQRVSNAKAHRTTVISHKDDEIVAASRSIFGDSIDTLPHDVISFEKLYQSLRVYNNRISSLDLLKIEYIDETYAKNITDIEMVPLSWSEYCSEERIYANFEVIREYIESIIQEIKSNYILTVKYFCYVRETQMMEELLKKFVVTKLIECQHEISYFFKMHLNSLYSQAMGIVFKRQRRFDVINSYIQSRIEEEKQKEEYINVDIQKMKQKKQCLDSNPHKLSKMSKTSPFSSHSSLLEYYSPSQLSHKDKNSSRLQTPTSMPLKSSKTRHRSTPSFLLTKQLEFEFPSSPFPLIVPPFPPSIEEYNAISSSSSHLGISSIHNTEEERREEMTPHTMSPQKPSIRLPSSVSSTLTMKSHKRVSSSSSISQPLSSCGMQVPISEQSCMKEIVSATIFRDVYSNVPRIVKFQLSTKTLDCGRRLSGALKSSSCPSDLLSRLQIEYKNMVIADRVTFSRKVSDFVSKRVELKHAALLRERDRFVHFLNSTFIRQQKDLKGKCSDYLERSVKRAKYIVGFGDIGNRYSFYFKVKNGQTAKTTPKIVSPMCRKNSVIVKEDNAEEEGGILSVVSSCKTAVDEMSPSGALTDPIESSPSVMFHESTPIPKSKSPKKRDIQLCECIG
ncbi:hypothetical protein ADUPG1_013136 [Aduncisulcus paluster]|uniref:Uncharacterized protein n=1 Tax=Aduncisulcus paluster TaxID=2918883 RepID=A0ABQ5K1W7_9EUKA|nr:hypothetical protein ADUPG1_013136 [Aduncisulcus paluster]